VLDKKRRFNCVDCKGTGKLKRVKFSLKIFESLACIMKIPSCVDNKAYISCGRGRLSCSHLTELNGKVYPRQAATPIMMESAVQTGAKTQSGGLNSGFSRIWYQVSTLVAVTAPPIPDTARHRIMNTKRPSRSRLVLG
jgi:hypothetical protein